MFVDFLASSGILYSFAHIFPAKCVQICLVGKICIYATQLLCHAAGSAHNGLTSHTICKLFVSYLQTFWFKKFFKKALFV